MSGLTGYHLQFSLGFHVETLYALFQAQGYLPIGLSDSGIDYGRGRESGIQRRKYLSAAHAVGPHPSSGDAAQDDRIGIGFDGIVDLPRRPVLQCCTDGFQSLLQQRDVVVVEGRAELSEALQRVGAFDHQPNSWRLNACSVRALSSSLTSREML